MGKMQNVEYRISAAFKMWLINAELCHQLLILVISLDCKAVATRRIPDINLNLTLILTLTLMLTLTLHPYCLKTPERNFTLRTV